MSFGFVNSWNKKALVCKNGRFSLLFGGFVPDDATVFGNNLSRAELGTRGDAASIDFSKRIFVGYGIGGYLDFGATNLNILRGDILDGGGRINGDNLNWLFHLVLMVVADIDGYYNQ